MSTNMETTQQDVAVVKGKGRKRPLKSNDEKGKEKKQKNTQLTPNSNPNPTSTPNPNTTINPSSTPNPTLPPTEEGEKRKTLFQKSDIKRIVAENDLNVSKNVYDEIDQFIKDNIGPFILACRFLWEQPKGLFANFSSIDNPTPNLHLKSTVMQHELSQVYQKPSSNGKYEGFSEFITHIITIIVANVLQDAIFVATQDGRKTLLGRDIEVSANSAKSWLALITKTGDLFSRNIVSLTSHYSAGSTSPTSPSSSTSPTPPSTP